MPADLLEVLRADPSSTVVASDFDGTLAPIVDDPGAALPQAGAVEALELLARRYAVVAVLSGRPVSFLEAHLPPAVQLHGLYGLEVLRGGVRVEPPGADQLRAAVRRAARDAAERLPDRVLVEDKGLSLTIHFRTSTDDALLVQAAAEALGAEHGLLVRPARMSVELHPPVAVDKGTALRGLAAGMRAACFVGDDAGDLAAFDALDELAATGVAAVRVAVASAEAPAELLRRADLVVDGPAAVVELFRSL